MLCEFGFHSDILTVSMKNRRSPNGQNALLRTTDAEPVVGIGTWGNL
jgi:hypothetical protein